MSACCTDSLIESYRYTGPHCLGQLKVLDLEMLVGSPDALSLTSEIFSLGRFGRRKRILMLTM